MVRALTARGQLCCEREPVMEVREITPRVCRRAHGYSIAAFPGDGAPISQQSRAMAVYENTHVVFGPA